MMSSVSSDPGWSVSMPSFAATNLAPALDNRSKMRSGARSRNAGPMALIERNAAADKQAHEGDESGACSR